MGPARSQSTKPTSSPSSGEAPSRHTALYGAASWWPITSPGPMTCCSPNQRAPDGATKVAEAAWKARSQAPTATSAACP